MRQVIGALVFSGLTSGLGSYQAAAPRPILPENARWSSVPAIRGLEFAWVLGAEKRSGLYALRVKLAPGAKIPPHAHPDDRYSTVLSGTMYVGFGEIFDESKVVAIPSGSLYVAPANVPHYIWTKDDAVVYQESGTGPTGTDGVK